ncbi:MAG: hypothetical protein M9963_12065 [Kiritimatiellae bacterium]|nr:hypothetical protein [Kiritimatiellia bacterium]MCO5062706.1 hypothetical protein [Kiritimatiellia bacterium]MCO6401064.1 hypothetical protein [Verrucomicrobiota bacterium]
MRKWIVLLAVGVVSSWGLAAFAEDTSGPHRFGVGAHYWKAVKDIDVKDVDEDGFSWVATYQYKPSAFGLGIDVEWKEKGFAGSTEDVYEPQAYLILGRALYAAAGVGGYYSDGEFADDPFYLFRAGFDVELLPSIRLDIHALYRFEKWDNLENSDTNADSDTITLGAALRIAL